MNYVILAAGQGSRFLRQGITTPKPMVPLLGVPMIERLIRTLLSCQCESIHIATNADMPELNAHLTRLRDCEGLPLVIKPIRSTNSFYSLTEACRGLSGRFIALSVDTIFPLGGFRKFVDEVQSAPLNVIPMALTRFIDDESPLYARLSPDGREITSYKYGGTPFAEGAIVSAGIYGLTDRAVASVARAESLSDFQRQLAEGDAFSATPHDIGKAFDVDCPHDRIQAEKFLRAQARREDYLSTLKSSDTEEHIDLAFYRPVGYAWALLFKRLHVTPNVVTLISIVFGVATGFLIYPPSLPINCLGILSLIIANSLDSADGQLARMTHQYSRLGRILDGLAGDLWFISIYVAIALRTVATVPWFSAHPWAIWCLASLAGICHIGQAAMADYFRQFHLFFVKKSFPAEFENSASLKAQYQQLTWRRPVQKAIMALYLAYTRLQEAATPATQALARCIHADHPNGSVPPATAEPIRRATLGLCKWENFLTFNWRSITLFVCILAGVPFVYFLAELTVFNLVLVYLTSRHERICRRLTTRR